MGVERLGPFSLSIFTTLVLPFDSIPLLVTQSDGLFPQFIQWR
jgi:hypothetical protein